ncbi:hypothetical protein DRZ78_04660, partial [Candidatus Aerophobetes bacterium]
MVENNNFLFYSPTKIHYGIGVLEKIREVTEEFKMARCLIVVEKALEKAGIVPTVLGFLTDMETVIYE